MQKIQYTHKTTTRTAQNWRHKTAQM